jgi:hypothetical protein
MKRFTMGMLLVVLVISPVTAFCATDSATETKGTIQEGLSRIGTEYRDQVKAIIAQYKGASDANRQLKAAGASYQKHLTAEVSGLSRYITSVGQAQMAGVYTYDAGYAALFMKKRELADSLNARTMLNEKLGFTMPLSKKLKQFIENPDRIQDYETWSDTMTDVLQKLIARGLDSDQRLCIVINYFYGTIIEGMYVVTESIAQSGYTPDMLALMDHQAVRLSLFLKLLNVFRGDAVFEKAVGFDSRFRLLGQVHNLMLVNGFARRDIDDIRRLISPERRAILAI